MSLVGDLAIGVGTNFANNLLSGGLGSLFGGNSARQQFKYQSRLQQQQYDLQKQMFDYTSEYNNDTNRLQRMKDAGLNPNLAYGQSSPAGSTGSIGQGSAPETFKQIGSSDLSGYIGAREKARSYQKQNDLADSQKNWMDAKAAGELLSNVDKNIRNKYAKDMLETQLDLMRKKAQNVFVDSNLKREQAITEVGRRYNIKADTMLKIAQETTEKMRPSKIASEIAKNNADVSYKKALATATLYSINLMDSQIGLNNALAHLKISEYTWQSLKNGDYEKITEKELAKIDAEIAKYYSEEYKNYYSGNELYMLSSAVDDVYNGSKSKVDKDGRNGNR